MQKLLGFEKGWLQSKNVPETFLSFCVSLVLVENDKRDSNDCARGAILHAGEKCIFTSLLISFRTLGNKRYLWGKGDWLIETRQILVFVNARL